MSVLDAEKRAAVVALLSEGRGIRETAREVGISKTTVTCIADAIGRTDRPRNYRPQRAAGVAVAEANRVASDRDRLLGELREERERIVAMLREVDEAIAKLVGS